jgi:uncharacterized protein (TIGR02246 family)
MAMKSARTPEEVDALFAERLNAGDAAGVAALYEADAVLVMPEGEQRGVAAIEAGLGALVEARLQLRMNVVKVVRAGADVAVLYNDWSGEAVGPDGAAVAMDGHAIEIVRRQADGSWRFVIDDPYARG